MENGFRSRYKIIYIAQGRPDHDATFHRSSPNEKLVGCVYINRGGSGYVTVVCNRRHSDITESSSSVDVGEREECTMAQNQQKALLDALKFELKFCEQGVTNRRFREGFRRARARMIQFQCSFSTKAHGNAKSVPSSRILLRA